MLKISFQRFILTILFTKISGMIPTENVSLNRHGGLVSYAGLSRPFYGTSLDNSQVFKGWLVVRADSMCCFRLLSLLNFLSHKLHTAGSSGTHLISVTGSGSISIRSTVTMAGKVEVVEVLFGLTFSKPSDAICFTASIFERSWSIILSSFRASVINFPKRVFSWIVFENRILFRYEAVCKERLTASHNFFISINFCSCSSFSWSNDLPNPVKFSHKIVLCGPSCSRKSIAEKAE